MRAGARNSDLILLMAGLTAMLAMTGLSFVLAAESGAPQHAGSSYATAPDGAKAAYVLLKDAGFAIRRSLRPRRAPGSRSRPHRAGARRPVPAGVTPGRRRACRVRGCR